MNDNSEVVEEAAKYLRDLADAIEAGKAVGKIVMIYDTPDGDRVGCTWEVKSTP